MSGKRVNIWINEDNVYFWDNLDNKSGWVNYIIEQFLENAKRKKIMEDKYEKNEKIMVQSKTTETKG